MNKNLTNNTNTELSNSNYPDFDGAIWDDAIDSENIVVDEADTAEELDTYEDCLDDSEELDDFDEADDEYYEDDCYDAGSYDYYDPYSMESSYYYDSFQRFYELTGGETADEEQAWITVALYDC